MAAALAAPALADDPQYLLFDLQSFAPGDDNVIAFGINNKGEIVGLTQAVDESSTYVAFVWLPFFEALYDNGNGLDPGLYSLDALSNFNNQGGQAGDGTIAFDINDAGVVVGRSWLQNPLPPNLDGAMWNLITNGMDTTALSDLANAFSINDDSTAKIVGGSGEIYEFFSTDPTQQPAKNNAFYYELGGSVQMLTVPDDTGGVALGVSDTNAGALRIGGIKGCDSDDNPSCSDVRCNSDLDGAYWPDPALDAFELAAPADLDPGPAVITSFVVGHAVSDDRYIAGFGHDVSSGASVCQQLGYFWSDPTVAPTALPRHPDADITDSEYAYDIRNEQPDGTIEIVGRNTGELNEAMLWRGVPDGSGGHDWSFIDLNSTPDVVLNLLDFNDIRAATAMNDDGWIAVWGAKPGDKFRSGILVPYDQYHEEICPADIVGPDYDAPDGIVDVFDLFVVLGDFGPCSGCPGDVGSQSFGPPDGVVDIYDVFVLLDQWGCQFGDPGQSMSLQEAIEDAGLTMDDWDAFEDVMVNSQDQQEKANYRCWMRRYLSGCIICEPCRGPDPYN